MTSHQKRLIDRHRGRISKAHSIEFANEMSKDERFAVLAFEKLITGNSKESANIIWSCRSLSQAELSQFPEFCSQILNLFTKYPDSSGIMRDGAALLQDIYIPEKLHAEVFNICLSFLQNHSRNIAEKVFSMTICYRIALLYPELLKELSLQIQENLLLQGDISPGIFSRGNAVLAKINQRLHK
jgi:hypothetical protein